MQGIFHSPYQDLLSLKFLKQLPIFLCRHNICLDGVVSSACHDCLLEDSTSGKIPFLSFFSPFIGSIYLFWYYFISHIMITNFVHRIRLLRGMQILTEHMLIIPNSNIYKFLGHDYVCNSYRTVHGNGYLSKNLFAL